MSPTNAMRLEGKVAVLTGCNPNIVGGIAEGMAEEGAKIVAVDIVPDYVKAAAAAIEKAGGEAIGVVCDVTKEDQVKNVVKQARDAFGGIDILVNGHVIQIQKNILDMPVDEWRRQIDVILTGNFLMTKHVAQSMIDDGRQGCIICITSTEAHQGRPTSIGCATGKSGLLNFARGCAATLAKYGIRVNTLTPTATDASEGIERAQRWGVKRVRVTASGNFEDMVMSGAGSALNSRLKDTPSQKLPSPRHYAKAAIFLASDDGEMITGFDLRVDGGNIAKYWGWHPDDPDSN